MSVDPAHAAAVAAFASGHPIATHAEGWSYGSIGIWLFGLIGTPTVVIGFFKLIAALRRLSNERVAAEGSSNLAGFRAVVDAQAAEIMRLTERIDKLEREATAERERHIKDSERRDALQDAELSLQRHATKNAKQVLFSFLDLVEAKPEDAAATAAKMRRRMEMNEQREAEEAARIRGAKIIAATPARASAPASPAPTFPAPER